MPLPPAEDISANIQWCSGSRHWAPKETFGGFKVCYQCRYMLQQRRKRLRDRKRLEKQRKLEQDLLEKQQKQKGDDNQRQQEQKKYDYQKPQLYQNSALHKEDDDLEHAASEGSDQGIPTEGSSTVPLIEDTEQIKYGQLNGLYPNSQYSDPIMASRPIIYASPEPIDHLQYHDNQQNVNTIAMDISSGPTFNPIFMYQLTPFEFSTEDVPKTFSSPWLPQPLQPSIQPTAVNNYQLNTPPTDFNSMGYSEFYTLSPRLVYATSPGMFNIGPEEPTVQPGVQVGTNPNKKTKAQAKV